MNSGMEALAYREQRNDALARAEKAEARVEKLQKQRDRYWRALQRIYRMHWITGYMMGSVGEGTLKQFLDKVLGDEEPG